MNQLNLAATPVELPASNIPVSSVRHVTRQSVNLAYSSKNNTNKITSGGSNAQSNSNNNKNNSNASYVRIKLKLETPISYAKIVQVYQFVWGVMARREFTSTRLIATTKHTI